MTHICQITTYDLPSKLNSKITKSQECAFPTLKSMSNVSTLRNLVVLGWKPSVWRAKRKVEGAAPRGGDPQSCSGAYQTWNPGSLHTGLWSPRRYNSQLSKSMKIHVSELPPGCIWLYGVNSTRGKKQFTARVPADVNNIGKLFVQMCKLITFSYYKFTVYFVLQWAIE